MLFSKETNSFYLKEVHGDNIPSDVIEITNAKHVQLLNAINSGCIIFDDLTYSEPKPSQFHSWNGSGWVDNRTAEEIAEYERSLLPVLPKRQFALYLYDHQLYDTVMNILDQNSRFKIEYETVKDLDRMSPTVSAMTALLEWTDDQVDEMWKEALTL